MKVKALVVNCSVNKTSVESLLNQLSGVNKVYVGGNSIAIEYEEERESALLNAIGSIKGVTNPTINEIDVSILYMVKIPGDREGYFVNGVRLPRTLENTFDTSGNCKDDICPIPLSIELIDVVDEEEELPSTKSIITSRNNPIFSKVNDESQVIYQ